MNGKVKASDTALGMLMNDFFCTDAKDMHYKELSDKVRYFKETEEGLGLYYKVLELFKPKDLFHSYEQNRF